MTDPRSVDGVHSRMLTEVNTQRIRDQHPVKTAN